MQLLPADYALCGITVVMAVTGLFRGFSGSLAFVLAAAAAALVASFGWTLSASFDVAVWMRAGGVLVVTLLSFGFVRLIVKKLVGGLLAQPSDALFGVLVGVALGGLLLVAWAYSGFHLEYSFLAQAVAEHVR